MGNGSAVNPNGPNTNANQGSPPKNRKKYELGGMMNPEEARMNRAYLQEIARVKRGDEPTDKLIAAMQNPIWNERNDLFVVLLTTIRIYHPA